jgi:putative copper export protein
MTAVLTILGWLELLGTVVLAGGIAYAALVAPLSDAGRRTVYAATLLVAAALLLEGGVTGLRLSPLAPNDGSSLAWNLMHTRWGALWIVRCVGLAAVVACSLGSRGQLILVALWLFARSLQGHAGAHGMLAALIDWVHLSAACVWVGGLLQLLAFRRPIPVATVERLRRVATVSVAALVLAGVYAAFLHIPALVDLVSTAYGGVVLAKIAIAAALIALGARNHFIHVPAMQRGGASALGDLRDAVRLEIAGGVLVLLLSALLGALPMPASGVH